MTGHTKATVAIAIAAALSWGAIVRAQEPTQDPPTATLVKQARAAEARGDFAAAGALFTVLTEREPHKREWVIDAAKSLRSATQFNDALDILEAGRQRLGDDADLLAVIATTYNVKGEHMTAAGDRSINVTFQFEQAARVADEGLRRHPEHRELRLVLAQTYYQLGKIDEATAEAEEAVRRFPQHPGGLLLIGEISYNEFVKAQQRMRSGPRRGKKYELLVLRAKDARDRATQAYERALVIDGTRAFPRVQLGNILAWGGNTEQALLMYEKALVVDATAAVNHAWINTNAVAKRRIDLYEKVVRAHRRTAKARKKVATVTWWLAWAQYQKRDFKAAAVNFVKAVEANPDSLNSRAYATMAAYWEGDHEFAERQATKYAEEAPRHFADQIRDHMNKAEVVAVLEFLAKRSYDMKRLDKCRAINHVLAMVLATARHWNNYAFLCRETGRYQQSYDGYLNALSLDPGSPQLLNDAAVILQYHLTNPENLRKARELYEQAIERARSVLRDPDATADEKSRARVANTDAANNLRKMKKDD